MASNQPTQAITVIPSDTINIPEPGSYITGGNTGTERLADVLEYDSSNLYNEPEKLKTMIY